MSTLSRLCSPIKALCEELTFFGLINWPIFNIVSKLDYRRHPSTLRWVPDWLRYGCDFSLGPMKHSALLQPSPTEVQPELNCTVVQWSAPSFWVHLLLACCTGRCTKKKRKKSRASCSLLKLELLFFFMVTEQVSPPADLIAVMFLLACWEQKHCYRNGLPPSIKLRPIAGRIM